MLTDPLFEPLHEQFVSHFWGEPVVDFVNCLAQHTKDRAYGGGAPPLYQNGSMQYDYDEEGYLSIPEYPHYDGVDGDDAKLWVCAYANRQWSLSSDVTDDPSETSFHNAIRMSKGTIALLDKDGKYFSRVWCDYEIYVSLTIADAERDAHARAHGKYTYDIYTAYKHFESSQGIPERRREAVGIVDISNGHAPADLVVRPFLKDSNGGGVPNKTIQSDPTSAVDLAQSKKEREGYFPVDLLESGLRAMVERGDASVATDRQHILNAIIGGGRSLGAPVRTKHARYDVINGVLNSRVLEGALQAAFVSESEQFKELRGDGDRDGPLFARALEVLRSPDSQFTTAFLDLFMNCDDYNKKIDAEGTVPQLGMKGVYMHNVLARLVAALPQTLTHLTLLNYHKNACGPYNYEPELPPFPTLPNLVSLDLTGGDITNLPKLSRIRNLTSLNLSKNKSLVTLPDLAPLTRLASLDLSECWLVENIPVSSNTALETLLVGCYQGNLTSLPDLEACTSLTTMHIQTDSPFSAPRLAPQLKHLTLPEKLVATPPLTTLTRLEVLTLTLVPDDPPDLSRHAQLRTLHLKFPYRLDRLDRNKTDDTKCEQWDAFIARFPHMQAAIVALPPDLFARNSKLESLSISKNGQLQALPPSLSNLTQLRSLSISGRALVSLPSLLPFTRLETLSICDTRAIESLPSLSACTQLKELICIENINLKSLPCLAACTRLERLTCNKCPDLKSLPSLSACIQLEQLDVGGNLTLGSLPSLATLTKLRTLDVDSCVGLRVLPRDVWLDELETVHLRGCSAYYTLDRGSPYYKGPDFTKCPKLETITDIEEASWKYNMNDKATNVYARSAKYRATLGRDV